MGEAARLRDIAATLGIRERMARAKFISRLGTSPAGYVRVRRLALTCQTLLESRRPDVALPYGFAEPGRFAFCHRPTFGEGLSATLRRRSAGRAATDDAAPAKAQVPA